jgi:thermitase
MQLAHQRPCHFVALLLLVIAACTGSSGLARAGSTTSSDARLLVKFRPGTTTAQARRALTAARARELHSLPTLGVRVVRTASSHARAAMSTLERNRFIECVERDVMRLPQEFLPSDPSFPQQFAVGGGAWGWYKTHTTQAWDITRGSASTVIAVLDTGLLTQGLGDFDGQTLAGWNVIKRSSDTSSAATDHGTHVAGVAGLALDNGMGNAGFCPACKIMPVQVGTSAGAYDADLAAGMVWAADHGARVINLSWAGPGASSTLANGVNYARSKGVVVVAAAGNTNCDCPNYPAATPGVIGVAGTSTTDAKQGDSNYGSWVKIAAPEGNMTACPSINGAPGYAPVGGTSLASPFVAGIAGLLVSANPALSGVEVEQALMKSATPVTFAVASGRVDALAALQLLGFSDAQTASAPTNSKRPEILLETNGDRNYASLTSAPQPGQVLLRGQDSFPRGTSISSLFLSMLSLLRPPPPSRWHRRAAATAEAQAIS